MLIDAHTHSFKGPADLCLVSGHHTRGLHPWELRDKFPLEYWEHKFTHIDFQNPLVMAIGECGLDRVHEGIVPIEQQKIIFQWHMQIALQTKKPLIVHSVRTHSDLLQVFKLQKELPICLLHDFNGNELQINEFLKYPVFFSLGRRLLKNPELLRMIPIERLLLETDDQQDVSLNELYAFAVKESGLNEAAFETQLMKNFLELFREHDDIGSSDFIKNFRLQV